VTRRRGRGVVISARGHPALQTTHAKTLEITRDTSVTPRATCVVGVAAEFDAEGLSQLRGQVELIIRAGGFEARGDAVIYPDHRVQERIVIRRSEFGDDDTLATRSTLTANDMGSDLAAALANPETAVTLVVQERQFPPPLLLVRSPDAPGARSRLDLLWRQADKAVSLGARSRTDLSPANSDAATVAVGVTCPIEELPAEAVDWLLAAVANGARVAVLGPRGTVAETLLGAGLPPSPVLWMGTITRPAAGRHSDISRIVHMSPVPVVLRLTASAFADLRSTLTEMDPDIRFAVPDETPDAGTRMVWNGAVRAGADEMLNVVIRSGGPRDLVSVRSAVRVLADAGVTPHVLTRALRSLGFARNLAYDIVLGLGTASSGPSADQPDGRGDEQR
jgi:hypothetical protein